MKDIIKAHAVSRITCRFSIMMWSCCALLFISVLTSSRADGDDDYKHYNITKETFPSDFQFGVATAAYQIEGAWNTDGKGEQVWDTFFHQDPSRSSDSTNGDVACDSYHRYGEDIAAMKTVGVHYYRFSIAWSRILPQGTKDNINQKGIEYYLNVMKALKDNGIKIMATIYHWDIPTALELQGGWLNPKVVDWFTDYAELCYEYFGDYVSDWVTINEPKQVCHGGYGTTVYAPGKNSSGVGEYLCARHALLAHAKAWRLYDQKYRSKHNARITIVMDSHWYEPKTASRADESAAEQKRQFIYGMYANPVIKGDWPKIVIDRIAYRSKMEGYNSSRLPAFSANEVELIKGTFDYIGLNHYSTYMVNATPEPPFTEGPTADKDSGVNIYQKSTWKTAAASWFKIVPWGFGKLLRWVKKTYGDHEIVITENGVSDTTGTLEDYHRIDYFRCYMSHMLDAMHHDKVRITKYIAWSIIDNFEWYQGLNAKLGMYYVNMTDPKRTRIPKKSSKYFAQVIKTRCLLDSCE